MTCSCILLFMSIDHIETGPGPKSTHARERDDAARLAESGMSEKEEDVGPPVPVQEQSVDGAASDVPEAESTPTGGR